MHAPMLHRLLSLVAAAALLAACTTTPRHLDVDQQLQSELRRIDNWQAQGKLGIRVNGEAQSANFDWQNHANAFDLRLSGPFGQGTTWLRRQGRTVTLESPDQPLQRARSAEELMQTQLGWQVPVSNLRYWIKGIAAPMQEVEQRVHNPDGTLAELRQQGWNITYSRYDMYNQWALPGKLVAERDDIKLTMIIKAWQLSPEQAQLRPPPGTDQVRQTRR